MTLHFSETLSLGEARSRLFSHYGIGADGGYQDEWVHMKMGPIPIAIPNTQGRLRAVKLHDLHHVATEYPTTWAGEGQISAWELAGGCTDHYAAWWLNFGGLLVGMVVAPRLTFQAFVRGRRSRNLYRESFSEAMLTESVGSLRSRLHLDEVTGPATASEIAAFTGFLSLALAVQLLGLAMLLAPLWMAWSLLT